MDRLDEPHPPRTVRRVRVAAVVLLALVMGTTAVLPAAAMANDVVATTHRLVVVVEGTLAPAPEKTLAVLVLVRRDGGAPAGAIATAGKPLTVLLDDPGRYRVRAEIDSACRGSCEASYRLSGSANHKLELVLSCRRRSSGFVCSKVKIVEVY